MAYRYTNTDKWSDSWFLGLKPIEKLLFNYLCDNCDIAGFIELHFPTIAAKIGCRDSDLKSALNGLTSRLYFSADNQVIYIRNFLEHQKNLPLNEGNKCHAGIIDRLQKNLQKFEFELIEDFFKAPSKPLARGYGNGIGNGIGINTSSSLKNAEINENDYQLYLNELRSEYKKIISDTEYISERQKFHPNLNIELSINKACVDFWASEAGYKRKKMSKSKKIDWKKTFTNALTLKCNHVYLQNGKSKVLETKIDTPWIHENK